MSSSSNANDSMSSSPGSDRGSGFSMKTFMLSVVFALCAASPISGGMMMPGMGMDPMMSMGMPGMGMGMPGMGIGGPGMGMGAPYSPYGYHYKRGRRYGLFGLRRRRGHWKPNNPYNQMGMPGMGMQPMGMGMGMQPMGMGMGGPMY